MQAPKESPRPPKGKLLVWSSAVWPPKLRRRQRRYAQLGFVSDDVNWYVVDYTGRIVGSGDVYHCARIARHHWRAFEAPDGP